MTKFSETSTFDGVWFPKHDSIPDGPKVQSMGRCKCGELWNKHRLWDGACPILEEPKNERPQ